MSAVPLPKGAGMELAYSLGFDATAAIESCDCAENLCAQSTLRRSPARGEEAVSIRRRSSSTSGSPIRLHSGIQYHPNSA